jgi:hypothetical protein
MAAMDTGDNLRERWHRAFGEHLAKRGPVAMTVEEVAGLLNVSPRHIYKLVSENKITNQLNYVPTNTDRPSKLWRLSSAIRASVTKYSFLFEARLPQV